MPKVKDTKKANKMSELIRKWKAGVQTKSAFCKSQNLSIHTFNYWLKKYRQENSDFLPVKIIVSEKLPERNIRFQFPKGISAEVPEFALPDFLRALISAG